MVRSRGRSGKRWSSLADDKHPKEKKHRKRRMKEEEAAKQKAGENGVR